MGENAGAGSVELVIFDCDGVLVDSEPLAMQVLLDAVAEAGVTLDPDQAYARFLGRSLASIVANLSENHQVELTSDALERMRLRLYDLFRHKLQPIAGIEKVLRVLEQRICVASSSQPERIHLALDVTGLRAAFGENVFSATMVKHGKPAPDLFLHAAGAMGVAPEACLVVEDSPAGVEAAKRAGMRVFGFTGGGHARHDQHRAALEALNPDSIFEDMAELPGLIAAATVARDYTP